MAAGSRTVAARGTKRRTPHVHPPTGTYLLTAPLWNASRPFAGTGRNLAGHVYQRVRGWSASKCDAGPALVSSKCPTYVVPPVPGATQRPRKPTKCNMWNHVRGVVAVTPPEKPQFRDLAPTLQPLRWQPTQAASAAESNWVMQALRKHVKTTRPREVLAEARLAPNRPRLLARHLCAPPWRLYVDTALTLQLASTLHKTRYLLTTLADNLLLSSWGSKPALLAAESEHHAAPEYTQAKGQTHRLYIASACRLQESAWLVK